MIGTYVVEMERVQGDVFSMADDSVVVEEPLEIQLEYGSPGQRILKSIAVTMRTPGHDRDLATGFLWTEGVITEPDAISEVHSTEDMVPQSSPENEASVLPDGVKRNYVVVRLRPDAQVRTANTERNFYTTSSCGVCGKASINALRVLRPARTYDTFQIKSSVLAALPGKLREAQPLFSLTGGLHGAALVSADGTLVLAREDVGRHNAVDKLIGQLMHEDKLPASKVALMLSGRVSFELMQKAVMAGIPFVAAVGAPSSLAITVAKEFEVTLVGFLRQGGFNVYSGFRRLTDRTIE